MGRESNAPARHLEDVLAEATGRAARVDPVVAGTGGPAGNAALTAWTGLTLLVLGFAEGLTLLDVRGLISWHVAIGALLLPPSLLKTASTGWRMLRYYLGAPAYRQAGPPPMVLRLLGPLVVVSTLALLGSGVVLVLLGEERSRQGLLTWGPARVDWVTVHQAAFIVWFAATALHVLGRLLPMVRLTLNGDPARSGVPGRSRRVVALSLTAVAGVVLAVLLVGAEGTWGQGDLRHDDGAAAVHGGS